MEGHVKGGSLEKLVERLTHHSIHGFLFFYFFIFYVIVLFTGKLINYL